MLTAIAVLVTLWSAGRAMRGAGRADAGVEPARCGFVVERRGRFGNDTRIDGDLTAASAAAP
jgi:hypothetical protein